MKAIVTCNTRSDIERIDVEVIGKESPNHIVTLYFKNGDIGQYAASIIGSKTEFGRLGTLR